MSSRLQRRCFVTSALVHGALGLLLVLAPAFRDAQSLSPAESPPLELIPGELIDAALAPGFLPPPQTDSTPLQAEEPPLTQTPPPQEEPPKDPEPEAPPPVNTPPPEELSFDVPKAREPGFTLPNARLDDKPKKPKKPEKPEREPVKIDLSKIKTLKPAETSARERSKPKVVLPAGPSAEELAQQRRQQVLQSLEGASGRIAGAVTRGTVQIQIGPRGGGGGGGGGLGSGGGSAYAWHVRNAFNNAWIAPQNVKDDLATVDVEVVIRRDGRVTRATLVKRSGIATLDRSVQEAVNRVREIVPFESEATEDQRSYTIGFNLRAKRSF